MVLRSLITVENIILFENGDIRFDYGAVNDGVTPTIDLSGGRGHLDLDWVVDTVLTPLRAIGGLDETSMTIREVASVADEASAVMQDMPEVIRWNAQLLAFELEEVESVMTTVRAVDSFAQTAQRFTQQMEALPGELRCEMTGALEDAENHQTELQTTLRETRTTVASIDKTFASLDETTQHLASAGAAWQGTFESLHTKWLRIEFHGFFGLPPGRQRHGDR